MKNYNSNNKISGKTLTRDIATAKLASLANKSSPAKVVTIVMTIACFVGAGLALYRPDSASNLDPVPIALVAASCVGHADDLALGGSGLALGDDGSDIPIFGNDGPDFFGCDCRDVDIHGGRLGAGPGLFGDYHGAGLGLFDGGDNNCECNRKVDSPFDFIFFGTPDGAPMTSIVCKHWGYY